MSDADGYNGWTNYETWVTALWIDNDESTYLFARSLIGEANRIAEGNEYTTQRLALADLLHDWQEDQRYAWEGEDRPASVFSDLLGAALQEVDWLEIADNYLAE